MQYTRWYDKDEQLKFIMETLENIDETTKISVAVDLIQMIFDRKYPHTDGFIDKLNEKYLVSRKRWYDNQEDLHSAIEMLKLVDGVERQELLMEIFYTVLHFKKKEIEE